MLAMQRHGVLLIIDTSHQNMSTSSYYMNYQNWERYLEKSSKSKVKVIIMAKIGCNVYVTTYCDMIEVICSIL